MKNVRVISTGAAVLAGLAGTIPTLGIWFSGSDGMVGSAVVLTMILVVLAALLAVASSVNGMLINPGSLRGAAVGLGSLLVVFVLSYVLADGSDYMMYDNVDESTTKWVSTGLNAFYICFILAIGAVLYSSLSRIRK
ncbi:MAG: hypothetical protein P8N56_05485 [Schleiferiaceae bacterium]|nr:hypothetical protein [Schleiferiaceae bacterium]